MQLQPFSPAYGSGAKLSVTTSSQAVASLPADPKNVVFTNLGTAAAYVRMAPDSAAATVADCCIPAGAQVTLTKSEITTGFRYIGDAATTLHYIVGEGW